MFKESGIHIEDTTPPQNPTSYTSSHNSTIPINSSLIRVDFSGAFDSLSGVKDYYYWMYYEPEISRDPSNPNDLEYIENYWRSSPWPSFEWDTEFSDDEWYLYVITRDAAGNFANDIYRAGPFLLRELITLQMEGIVSNSFGEIFANSFTQVTIDPLKYPGKDYELAAFRIFDNEPEGDPLEYSEPFYISGKDDGSYTMQIFGVDANGSEEMYLFPLTVDNTAPSIGIHIEQPNYSDGLKTYVNRDTAFALNAADGGSGLRYVGYSLLESDWIPYARPFALPAFEDGIVVMEALALDNLGNDQKLEQLVYLDNTSPEIRPEIGAPKLESESLHVTRTTALTADIQDAGSGLDVAQYAIFTDTESPEWMPYVGPFTLPDMDGVYDVSYRALDMLGNESVRTLTVVNDNTGPHMTFIFPPPGTALQDVVEYRMGAQDISGVQSVSISIRNAENPYAPLGFEAMSALFDSSEWVLQFDTLLLPDGDYMAIATATDGLGNQSQTTLACSIRNVALLEMLPASKAFVAGRTVPVKFSLKLKPSVDPMEPFVYNENLEVHIYQDNRLLQKSCFGETSRDYRISVPDQLYITIFQTLKTRAEYTVMLYRGPFLVGSFTFETTN